MGKIRKANIIGTVVWCQILAPANAQVIDTSAKDSEATDPAEEVIVVTGLRPAQLSDVVGSVTVLGPGDLAIRDAGYLADHLRAVPGVSVSRSGAFGGLTQVRMRGAEANHTLVLIEGIEASDPATGEFDFGLLSALETDRVEILRGEQSTLYGSDAIGGVINVSLKDLARSAVSIEGGSFGSGKFAVGHGVEAEDWNFSALLSGIGGQGVDTSGLDGERDGSGSVGILISGAASLDANWQLNTLLRYHQSRVATDADTDFDGFLNDVDNETESDYWLFGMSLLGDALGVNHQVKASFSEVMRDNFVNSAFVNSSKGLRRKFSYSPSKELELYNGTLALSALVDVENEKYERRDTDVSFGDSNQRQLFSTIGIAGEAVYSLGPADFSGSVRYDINTNHFDDAVTWRVGAGLHLTEATRLRASAGIGVKNPTFTELFGFFPASFIGNPDLVPESSKSYEVALEHSFRRLDVSIGYFNAKLKNEIATSFTPSFLSTPINRAGKSSRKGIETSATLQLSQNLQMSGGYTRLTSRNDLNELEIRVPRNTGSLSLSWQNLPKLNGRIGLAVDYVGKQNDLIFTFPTQDVVLPAYTLVSATVDVPLSNTMSFTLRGENLLDQDVFDVFGYSQQGLGVFAGIKIR